MWETPAASLHNLDAPPGAHDRQEPFLPVANNRECHDVWLIDVTMRLYRLFWFFIVLEISLGAAFSWYEAEHLPHTAGYRPWVVAGFVLLIAAIQIVNKVDDTRKSRGRLSGLNFLESYMELLTNAIEALQDLHEYNEEQIREAQRKILKLIASIVVLFCHEVDAPGINVNLMEREETAEHAAADRFHDYVHFTDPTRAASSYHGVLCVRVWANDPEKIPEPFALPIDADSDRVLFGAPRTYATGREIVIPNIHKRGDIDKLMDGQPKVVKQAVHDFFRDKPYKTFLSIPVRNSDKVVAVLNIQADRVDVFGRQTKQAAMMKKFIDPFRTILGILTAQTPATI